MIRERIDWYSLLLYTLHTMLYTSVVIDNQNEWKVMLEITPVSKTDAESR